MILVTGASGFIGKHLCVELENLFGADNLLCLSSSPVPYGQFLFHENYSFKPRFFIEHGFSHIQTIIHAGAFTPKSAKDANNDVECMSNITSTQAILGAAFPQLKKIIFLSSLDVYEKADIISEDTLINPETLYGASKWYCEKMVLHKAREKNIAPVILRIGHIYGPGEEKYRKIIPQIMSQIINGEDIKLKNGGLDKRSFLYINDVINYIIQAIMLDVPATPINLGGSEAISIRELVEKIITLSGSSATIHVEANTEKITQYVFDLTLMESFFKKRETPLDKGLEQEWAHMKKILS